MADAILRLKAAKGAIAPLLVKEQGKPLNAAEGEIDGCCMLLQRCVDLELPEDVYSETETRKVVAVRPTQLCRV
jgi:acyl-CoA reductase-like NAD-dependent aldehyde dehydrogenase